MPGRESQRHKTFVISGWLAALCRARGISLSNPLTHFARQQSRWGVGEIGTKADFQGVGQQNSLIVTAARLLPIRRRTA